MQHYIGVKSIKAKPMTRQAYNDYRNWTLPSDEDGSDEGYLVDVEYIDSSQGNHPNHYGYISWEPAEIFKRAYRPVSGMTFGLAIEAMKKGYKVARKSWNEKDMWIVYMPELSLPPYSTQGTSRKVNDRTAKWIGEDTPLDSQPYIAMWTADKKWQPGWLASQADILAEDWMIIPE